VTAADSVALERMVTFSLAATPTAPDRVTAAAGQTTSTVRSTLQANLPWDVTVARADSSPALSGFAARRRLLGAGFLLLVCLALAASFLIVRAVSREMAVARLQSDFVAAVSHEFRTPLTTLRQFTDMLREHEVLTDERRRICYDAQSRATSRLTRLVESLLDFGRMEAGAQPYTLEPHDCTTLVRGVVDEFQPDAQAAGCDIRFRGNGGAPVQADPDALSRAIWNLLDNAVKYSPGRNAIDVAVHREDSDVTIAVTDRGIGIPADERLVIFGKFQRGIEARSLGIKGTGLGLTMVDQIVRAHHGRVEVESEPGEGSTFRIHLPVTGDT
jgi:signal transduction histidine kinase